MSLSLFKIFPYIIESDERKMSAYIKNVFVNIISFDIIFHKL